MNYDLNFRLPAWNRSNVFMRVPLKTFFINTSPLCAKTIGFLVNKRKNNDIEFLCDGKLINFLSYYFKLKLFIYWSLVSMIDLFSTLTTSLCLGYLSNNLKKSP